MLDLSLCSPVSLALRMRHPLIFMITVYSTTFNLQIALSCVIIYRTRTTVYAYSSSSWKSTLRKRSKKKSDRLKWKPLNCFGGTLCQGNRVSLLLSLSYFIPFMKGQWKLVPERTNSRYYVQSLTFKWLTLSSLLMMANKAETAVHGRSVNPMEDVIFDTLGSCSHVDCTAFRVPGNKQDSLEPGPTLVDMVTTGFGPGGQ